MRWRRLCDAGIGHLRRNGRGQRAGRRRVLIAQAAVGAILTVAVADGEVGPQRLIDALIGAGVALVFSQILFTPEPVALVRRAEAAALADMADGLGLTAQALERDDDAVAERAMSSLRGLRDRLAEVGRTRRASKRVVRHSLVWRSQRMPVVRENENAGHLDLLGGSCLMLARTAMITSPADRRMLAPSVRDLAGALAGLARQPGDRSTRQAAVNHALDVARRLVASGAPPDSPLAAAIINVRMVTADIMIFAGVDPDQALHAVREGTGQLSPGASLRSQRPREAPPQKPQVPTPPKTPATPFTRRQRRRTR